MALAPGHGILAHRNADGGIHAYVAVNRPEEWLTGRPTVAVERVTKAFEGWAAPLRALIVESERTSVIRSIHQRPTGLRRPRVPDATLLGDAAHLMSPFAGEGANLAMLDGVELGLSLVDHRGAVEDALRIFESRTFKRGRRAAEVSASNLARFYGPGAPESVVDLFASR